MQFVILSLILAAQAATATTVSTNGTYCKVDLRSGMRRYKTSVCCENSDIGGLLDWDNNRCHGLLGDKCQKFNQCCITKWVNVNQTINDTC